MKCHQRVIVKVIIINYLTALVTFVEEVRTKVRKKMLVIVE